MLKIKYQEEFKIPKGQSESVYRRRTDNTMAKRYQRGNQKPYIEEGQTTQWPEEKVQKDKQRSTKHTYKPIDRVTRTPPKTGGELRCSGRVSSSCSTINFGIVPTVWESLFFIVLFAYINRVFFFEHTRQN
jgi:hypothetical protein